MTAAIKKTVSLPPELARDAENTARAQGKTVSAVVQEALRLARQQRLAAEYGEAQTFWSRQAVAKGIVSEADLERYLSD